MSNTTPSLAMVILAAGEGTRMKSATPKVLHPLLGRLLIRYPLALAERLGVDRTVVVIGRGADALRAELADLPTDRTELVVQEERLGTAHAVDQARSALADHPGLTIVTCGDMPLVREETLRALVAQTASHGASHGASLALATASLPDPAAYGRIVRDESGAISRIVEASVATEAQLAIREVNLGIYAARSRALFDWIERVERDPRKGEYLLTDIVDIAVGGGSRVETATASHWTEGLGVNSRADLADAEAHLERRVIAEWMQRGVTFERPETSRVDIDVTIGQDTVIRAGVSLRGVTRIGANCRISEGCVLEDATIGDQVWIKPHCAIESATVQDGAVVGPLAHIGADATLATGVRVGSHVSVGGNGATGEAVTPRPR